MKISFPTLSDTKQATRRLIEYAIVSCLTLVAPELPKIVDVISGILPPSKLLKMLLLSIAVNLLLAFCIISNRERFALHFRFGALWKLDKKTKKYDQYPYCPSCKNGLTSYEKNAYIQNIGNKPAFYCNHCKSHICLTDEVGRNLSIENALAILNSNK